MYVILSNLLIRSGDLCYGPMYLNVNILNNVFVIKMYMFSDLFFLNYLLNCFFQILEYLIYKCKYYLVVFFCFYVISQIWKLIYLLNNHYKEKKAIANFETRKFQLHIILLSLKYFTKGISFLSHILWIWLKRAGIFTQFWEFRFFPTFLGISFAIFR